MEDGFEENNLKRNEKKYAVSNLRKCRNLVAVLGNLHHYSNSESSSVDAQLNKQVRGCGNQSASAEDSECIVIELNSDRESVSVTAATVNENISSYEEVEKNSVNDLSEAVHEPVSIEYSNSTSVRRRFVDTSIISSASYKKRKFFCQVNNCYSSFLHRAMYIRHMNNHEAVTSKCQICFKMFSNVGELLAHKLEAHKGHSQESYTCSHCNKTFASSRYRERHLRRVTKDGVSHVCNVCGKIFHDSADLSIHKKNTHTDDRQFSCKECGMNFKRETHAISHMKTHFSTDTHVCDICNREFNDVFILLRHKKVHTANKYTCTECGAGFEYKASLAKHKKHQHPKLVTETPKHIKGSKQVYAYRLKKN